MLKTHESLILMGSSMGGIIATPFAVKYPDRISHLILLDPAGLPTKESLPLRCLKIPLLNRLLFRWLGVKRIIDNAFELFHDPTSFSDYETKFRRQTHWKGYSRTLLSTLLEMPLEDFSAGYQQLNNVAFPILILWGEKDTIVPLSAGEKLKVWLSAAEFHVISAAGHLPHYERPQAVNSILESFLSHSLPPSR